MTASPDQALAAGSARRRFHLTQELIVLGLAVALFAVFAATLQGFLTTGNILNLVRNVAMLGILSLGMAVVVIGRGVDLSLVAVMAVSLTVAVVLANGGYPFAQALLFGLAFVIAVAAVMGFLIAYVEVPAIFATLAVSAIVYGAGRGIVAQLDVNNLPNGLDWFVFLGRGSLLGIPMPIYAFGAAALLLYLFLQRTGLGRFIYAIGDNQASARITGLPVRPLIILQYVISGVMAFLAGCVTTASVASMNMRMVNSTLIYDVLLVVILGGIGLAGGRGGVRNVLVGTILIGLLLNGMTILDISYIVQNLVKSAVLLCALVVDAVLNPRDEQTSQQGDI